MTLRSVKVKAPTTVARAPCLPVFRARLFYPSCLLLGVQDPSRQFTHLARSYFPATLDPYEHATAGFISDILEDRPAIEAVLGTAEVWVQSFVGFRVPATDNWQCTVNYARRGASNRHIEEVYSVHGSVSVRTRSNALVNPEPDLRPKCLNLNSGLVQRLMVRDRRR